MSHITRDTTQIVFVQEVTPEDLQLLRDVAALVAEAHGGQTQDFYLDYYDRQQTDCLIVIQFPELFRGIGIALDNNGALTFVGDSWGYRDLYAQVQQQFIQTYVVAVQMKVMAELGYNVETVQGPQEGQLLTRGVQYV